MSLKPAKLSQVIVNAPAPAYGSHAWVVSAWKPSRRPGFDVQVPELLKKFDNQADAEAYAAHLRKGIK